MSAAHMRGRRTLSSAFRSWSNPARPALHARPRFSHNILRRAASTGSSSSSAKPPARSFLRTIFLGGSVAASLVFGYLWATDTRAAFHRWLVPPLLFLLFPDAEDAHHAGTVALRNLYALNLHPRERPQNSAAEYKAASLGLLVLDANLANPIGISAGLDKDADIPDALFALGAAVVEVGGCTPRPQEGNPKPRVFRVPSLDGMVNRCGLNSRGADAMAARLRDRLRRYALSMGLTEQDVLEGRGVEDVPIGSLHPGRLLLVQIAKNKATDEKDVGAVIRDYIYCVNRLATYADVLVVNVSSPNTPGLRDLQAAEPLAKILSAVVDEARRTQRGMKPKVMVKVSPDEDDTVQIEGVVQAVWTSGVDGVIVGNTTKQRTGLVPPGLHLSAKEQRALMEEGGFSGHTMFDRTLGLVRRYRKMLDGFSIQDDKSVTDASTLLEGVSGRGPVQKVIFATGGITNGEEAIKILNAGANVAMVYTGLVYGGSGTITRIKDEMKKAMLGEIPRGS